MPERVRLTVDGRAILADADVTVAAALWNAGVLRLRQSAGGEPRGVLCAMGICYECRVAIDGVPHRRACMELVRDGMAVSTAPRQKPETRNQRPPHLGRNPKPHHLSSTDPHTSPAPKAVMRTMSPSFTSPSRAHSSSAIGIEAADVLP
jgi:D-hydroxyproline dehydrogenase subunit gamma